MICNYCTSGGELNKLNQLKRAASMHKKCKGDCCCQHKTGPATAEQAAKTLEPMRTQYPLE